MRHFKCRGVRTHSTHRRTSVHFQSAARQTVRACATRVDRNGDAATDSAPAGSPAAAWKGQRTAYFINIYLAPTKLTSSSTAATKRSRDALTRELGARTEFIEVLYRQHCVWSAEIRRRIIRHSTNTIVDASLSRLGGQVVSLVAQNSCKKVSALGDAHRALVRALVR